MRLALALGSIAVFACSGPSGTTDSTGPASTASGLQCGPGTIEENNLCVVDCPDGARAESGTCVVDTAAVAASYAALADELCACNRDRDCSQSVIEKRDNFNTPYHPSPELVAAMKESDEMFESCMPMSTVVAEFADIKDDMCLCKDSQCAAAVNKQFEEWLKANEKAKGSEGEQEQAKKIAEDYTKCMMNAMANPGP